MNRKKTSKVKQETLAQQNAAEALDRQRAAELHPYDDLVQWIGQRWETPPWSSDQIARFQDRLDSAFGAKDAIVLAWSGDTRYWDALFADWHPNGLPKGVLEKKPILLFAQYNINEDDYLYIIAPRWMLLEKLHPNEYAAGWEDAKWVEDNRVLGGKKQIRADNPPPAFYKVLKTIAEHETPYRTGDIPPCCERWRKELMRICYGKYRPPADEDLAYVRAIRENMDKAGVAQRSDAPRSAKVLQDAAASTQHHIRQAAMARTRQVSEMIALNPQAYLGEVIQKKGITLSQREIDECVQIGLERVDENRQKELNI